MKKTFSILLILLLALTASAQEKNIDLYITGSYTLDYYEDEEDGTDWFFQATDDSGKYIVRIDYRTDYAGKYGTYTLENIDRDYSYIKDYSGEEMEYRNYLEGTTVTISEINGLLHMEGALVCDNGITYNLHVDHKAQTFNIEGTEFIDIYYFTEDTDWYMRFKNNDYRVTLDLNTGAESKFAGTYTETDAISGYNFITDLNTGNTDSFTKMNVTLSLPKGITDPSVSCEITGTAISDHGDVYNFHMKKNPPITPIKTVNVNVKLNNVEWPSEKEDYKSYFEVTDTDNPDIQWTLALDALRGTLDESHFIDSLTGRINTLTEEKMHVDNGIVTISLDVSNIAIKVNATLVMTDSIEYDFAFEYEVENKGEAFYSFKNLKVYDDYYDEVGTQWIDASDDEASIEVTLTKVDIPGEYDDDNASIKMAVTGEDGETNAVTAVALFYARTTIDEHNQPILSAKFIGDDKKIYTVEAHFDVPEPVDTLNISIDGLKVNDYITDNGVFQIYGYSNDSTMYVTLAPTATKFSGHYTTESLTAYRKYCMLALLTDGTWEQNDFYSADFNVSQNDKKITLTGKFQAGRHIVIMTLEGTIREQGLDYDNEDEDLDAKFTTDDLVSLEKDESNGYAYVELQNTTRNDIFAMLVYLNSFDDDIIIPSGIYNVSDTYTAPSIQPGQIYSSSVYPTFYGTLSNDGYLSTPLWFLTTGTVTVMKTTNKELSFEVNGKNSYGRTFHIIYNGGETGVKDIITTEDSAIKKVLENGHIVIKKQNQKYSLDGQRIE